MPFILICSRHLTVLRSFYCKEQIDVIFFLAGEGGRGVYPLNDDKFHHNIVNVY